ncbi:sensor histidine kinase [Miniphocaeibacter massiliensis]|uniref:sensor histidine kinase n=1 Tax=Miniphocaeibacter massiliensis TaxID=2041841 RepID=UPI000C084FD4|nr:HAMP domain-containing sensor histidine kinase [Miniphocaeibacter massiliensis]
MTVFIISICLVMSVFANLLIYRHYNVKERNLTNSLKKMIDDAKEGKLEIKSYDETRLSSLENSFYNFILKFQASEKDIEEKRSQVQTLISDISHQCITPISNIVLYSQLLEENKNKYLEKVPLITSESFKLEFLIKSLIKMSRFESGMIKPNMKIQPVKNLLCSLKDEFSNKLLEKNILFKFKELDGYANFDLKWTKEALSNILDNAIKYSSENSVIELKAESYPMFTKIDIVDEGMGISENEQNKIFQRFYRSKSVSEINGVGIGLYLSRQIIHIQGGYIKVKSLLGKGTVFSVFIPNE